MSFGQNLCRSGSEMVKITSTGGEEKITEHFNRKRYNALLIMILLHASCSSSGSAFINYYVNHTLRFCWISFVQCDD